MSKDVAVTGIQLTATTPELIEISFGRVESNATSTLLAPRDDAEAGEWVHSAATGSVYEKFGKLKPVSSIDGYNMWYTNDATDKGRGVSTANSFVQTIEGCVGKTVKGSTTEANAAITAEGTEGYYLDIPVWFRTTKAEDVNLGVIATIQNPGAYNNGNGLASGVENTDTTKLYKAARVSILAAADSGNIDAVSTTQSSKVIMCNEASYYTTYDRTGKTAVQANGDDATAWADVYGNVSEVTQVTVNDDKQITNSASNPDAVATVKGRTSTSVTSGYAKATKYIIRVWLEGEDQACWNANAAQSFVVGLNFYDLSNVASSGT